MTVSEWNTKLKDSGISSLYLSKISDSVHLIQSFGDYGDVCVKLPQHTIDTILEKLYKRKMDFKRQSILFRLGCKCWNKDIDTLTRKFESLFNDYETTGNVQPIVEEINNYCPEYKNNKYPDCYSTIFQLHDSFYDRNESYLSNFLDNLFSNIKVKDAINLCGRSQGHLNRWFYTETEYSLGIGKTRIICDLGINTLDWIGADICHKYDKIFGSIFDKSNSEEKELKLKEIISSYTYNDLIDCLSKDVTRLQPVQVHCGGAPMYDHTDHKFVTKLHGGKIIEI